jgi:serine/threonine-protein kinase
MEDIEASEPGVTSGELLETPGYTGTGADPAPMQSGARCDLYALGSILFEVLAGEPLHPRGQLALQSTLAGEIVKSPAQRRPDRGVAPELDAACVAALAMSPAARPTARQLADRIEAYLDGDRDVARRRQLALEELWNARAAMTAAIARRRCAPRVARSRSIPNLPARRSS